VYDMMAMNGSTQLHDELPTAEEYMKLKRWKDEIAQPAIDKNEEYQLMVDEFHVKIEHMSLQIEEYSKEVSKLKNEKQDLEAEVASLNKLHSHSINNDDVLSKTLQEKEEEVEALQNQCEKLQQVLSSTEEAMRELSTQNEQLRSENEQYEMILDKLQKDESNLRDKIKKESEELNRLKAKYSELETERLEETELFKHQSVFAQELLNEVDDLRSHANMFGANSGHSRRSSAGSGIGFGIHSATKTLRLGAHTLRLANMDSNVLGAVNEDTTTVPRASGYIQFAASDTQRTLPHGILYDGDEQEDDMKHAHDHDYAAHEDEQEVRELLESEFEEKLQNEKGKLMQQHEAEVEGLKATCLEASETVKELKRKLLEKNEEIQRLKNASSNLKYQNGRNLHKNPNNKEDLSKCKVFGWTAW